ncbi:hypothetical protein QN397_23975 [Variovorax sp. RTB1]|uniref:hypothetical protein n=1 Tax=Variovorax sp. RTB1 TaxID=3048631 RepID=UPI002B22E9E9|nr:hypothetical protein [Variovorax sp. RTB1]MEB0114342.1 hypothetical protein [Variovorax sp. RTB1]
MYAFDTVSEFRAAGPAAVALIDYLDNDVELKSGLWNFERGTVSSNGRSRAWAVFSQEVATNLPLRDRVSIIAMETVMDGWVVAHTMTRAER